MSEVTQARSVVALSEAAATKVRDLLAREGRDDLALRVAVEPGGCSGPPAARSPTWHLEKTAHRRGSGRYHEGA